MRIDGSWLVCPDRGVRPVVRVEVLRGDGEWKAANLMVDSGADRTAFDADLLANLGLATLESENALAGVGGVADSVLVETQLRFTTADGQRVTFRGRFAEFTEPSALDISVLGRDITNLFAVIVDRPRDVVCLLNQRHSYNIIQS